MIDEMASESSAIRASAIAKILDDHQGLLQKLAALVEQYVSDAARAGAAKDNIFLLGKLHAKEYVPLLVQNLTFEVFYKNTKRPQTLEDLYPAVQALIDIGSPSLKPILERLKHEDGEDLRRTGAAVLRGVLGVDWARAIVEQEIMATESPGFSSQAATANQTKQRLQQVIALLGE